MCFNYAFFVLLEIAHGHGRPWPRGIGRPTSRGDGNEDDPATNFQEDREKCKNEAEVG